MRLIILGKLPLIDTLDNNSMDFYFCKTDKKESIQLKNMIEIALENGKYVLLCDNENYLDLEENNG